MCIKISRENTKHCCRYRFNIIVNSFLSFLFWCANYLQVVTYKNLALDNFLLDCLTKVSSPDVKIVRVGTLADDADYRLKQCLLRQVCSLVDIIYSVQKI